MRPPSLEQDETVDFNPPLSSPCNHEPHKNCRWHPYSNSRDFDANAAIVVILLLCALICGLALHAAIRCFRRRGHNHHLPQTDQQAAVQQLDSPDQKKNLDGGAVRVMVGPTIVFYSGMKEKLAGAEAECAICLSEFVEGEGLRVLENCKHGFHLECIEEWLSSHSSCPTCRCSCLSPVSNS